MMIQTLVRRVVPATVVAVTLVSSSVPTWSQEEHAENANLKPRIAEGLRVWFDATGEQAARQKSGAAPLAPGQGVDVWHDLSGNRRHVRQLLRDARPTWEESFTGACLQFDGNDCLIDSQDAKSLSEATVFIVAAPDESDGNFNAFLAFSGHEGDDFQTGFNVDLGATPAKSWSTINVEGAGQPGAVDLLDADVPYGEFHVVSVRTRPGDSGTEVRFDGMRQRTRDRRGETLATDELVIGARFNRYGRKAGPTPFVQQFLKGRIAAILVYDRLLSDDEMTQVEQDLMARRPHSGDRPDGLARVGRPAVPPDAPLVQMFTPGFVVRELPVALTNINNIEFDSDGRLFAAGYDGRLHVLTDTDNDGLEDNVTTFLDEKSEDYPLGIAIRGRSLYVVRRHQIMRHDDTDGDGVPDTTETAAQWTDAEVPEPFRDGRRVSGGLGLAIGSDGSLYTSTGSLNTFNAYMLEGADEKPVKPEEVGESTVKSLYDLHQTAGTVLRFTPGAKQPEIVATGVRYLMSMHFNRSGDLFATEQEGATWLANGNPFDELLHIEPSRHYGFPPRHPRYLPSVVDEPSVFDFSPQHQSACGFRFNERTETHGAWGPASWEGDALVTGESRGKLFRTKLVKTPQGYVAQNHIMGGLAMLPVDLALSPTGDLVIACHSGEPDWGTGPGGSGKLFKISYAHPDAPMPVAAWAASPTETCIEFDKPLDPQDWSTLRTDVHVEGGAYVGAGDRFEALRPGYAVVQRQSLAPRWRYPVMSAALGENGRSILLRTPSRTQIGGYSIELPFPSRAGNEARHELSRSAGLDLGFDLTGVEASWHAEDEDKEWSGWLPHVDWNVASQLTAGSEPHERLRDLVKGRGRLTLRGQFDLNSLLHPAVQPGSRLDYEYPPETVTVAFESQSRLDVHLTGMEPARAPSEKSAAFTIVNPGDRLIPLELTVETGSSDLALSASWSTNEDSRPRAFPLRRILMPWAHRNAADPTDAQEPIPEIAGGDWNAGRALFFGGKLNCSACHTIRGEGGKIAPELTNLIHRDYASVLKDIRRPNAAINPDFLSYAIETQDGHVLTGVLNGSTDQELQIGGTDGKTTRLPRSEAAAISPSRISIMPEKLLDQLSEDDLRNLMTFLLTSPKP